MLPGKSTLSIAHWSRNATRGVSRTVKRMSTMAARKTVVFLHPDLGIGGAERLVVDAAVGLQDEGYKVVIFTSHCDPTHCFDEARDGELPYLPLLFEPRTTTANANKHQGPSMSVFVGIPSFLPPSSAVSPSSAPSFDSSILSCRSPASPPSCPPSTRATSLSTNYLPGYRSSDSSGRKPRSSSTAISPICCWYKDGRDGGSDCTACRSTSGRSGA